MNLIGNMGRRFALFLALSVATVSSAMGQNQFAVIQIANATDDVTIQYQFAWGSDSRLYTVKAESRSSHHYRYEPDNQFSYPVPTISFVTGIDRAGANRRYELRPLASPSQDRGGQQYVFEKRIDAQGEEYIDLVSVTKFLSDNSDVASRLLAEKRYPEAIKRCDLALSIDATDAKTINLRARANDLLRKFGRSINDQITNSVRVQETRLDTSVRSRIFAPVPVEFVPYITPEAYDALANFRLGSKVDADENYRLQVAYDRAYEEGRYIDAQEANYIRAIEREPVAALWKMVNEPGGNDYYWPNFTPVEERLDGLRQPLVGRGSDKMIYVKSDDDLAGLRLAIRRAPQNAGDGGIETAAIIPLRWVKDSGVVPLDPPDNLRVLMRLKENGDHAMLGMSFSLTTAADGTWDLRPEIYTSPKFGDDRFKGAASTVVSPRGCMDCHALGFNLKGSKFVGRASGDDAAFANILRRMPGIDGFLADARKRGASEPEIARAESIVIRPDLSILKSPNLRIAVIKLWNAIYYANQPYLDDADSRFIEYHDRYGSAWLEAGDFDKALDHFIKAVGRGPDRARLYLKRGRAHLLKHRFDDALRDFDQAIRLEPRSMAAHNLRARLLATAPDPKLRDGAQAVRSATSACELAGWKSAEYLDTLAAAHAENGDFGEAVKWQEKALETPDPAQVLGERELKAARDRLELYRQNRPFRETSQ